MSILIKGMKMPKNCADCDLEQCDENYYGDQSNFQCPLGYKAYTRKTREIERLEKCPLIEVPEDVQPVKWIPVSEQLPPLDEEVLVFTYGNMIRVWVLEKQYPYSADVYWECEDGYWEDVSVATHWMPLPQKPKDGET